MCRGLAASRTDLISMCNSQVSGCGFETHAEQPVKLPCLYFHYQLLSMLHINSEDAQQFIPISGEEECYGGREGHFRFT